MRRSFPIILSLAVLAILPSRGWAAAGSDVGTYSMSLAYDPGVVMVDSTATLSVQVTNTTAPGGASIGWIRLDVAEPLYYASFSSLPPDGWDVVEIKNAGLGQSYVIYEAQTSADVLDPGETETFDMVVTGSGDGPFVEDVNDMTDTFYAVTIHEDDGNKAGNFTGTPPSWTRYSLKPIVTATPASVGTSDLITVQVVLINRSTVTQASVAPVTPTISGTGSVSLVSGPDPASATIDPGDVQVYTFIYQASSTGEVNFTSRGTNGISGSGAVSSPWATSNAVTIGDFTAQVEMVPTVAISGQSVEVKLTLTNNGSTSLGSIVPNISTSGSATMSLDSGPTPAGAGALNPGASKTFTWLYTVTGSVGDTFQASVWGTSSTVTSNTAQSVVGEVSAYSATAFPDNLNSGATNVSVTFTVFNNGGYGVQKIRINTPSDWVYASGTPPTGWGVASSGNPTIVSFTSGGTTSDIPVGDNESFVLTFSTVPTVPSDTPYNFLVEIWDRGQSQLNQDPRGALETTVVVTPYAMAISCTDPDGSPTQVADGVQYYDLLATLTLNTVPVSGANVLFTTTAGSLSSGSVATDINGESPNTLTAPLSTVTVSATVTANYLGAFASAVCVFDPYGGLALDYVPGTLGPTSSTAGSTAVVFAVSVINTGTANIDLFEASTYFIFDDSSVGGTNTFQAFLDNSAPTVIGPGGTAVLTFLAADVDAGFSPGSFLPELLLDDGITSGTRPVTDPVTISGGGTIINIIRWHETIQ